MSRSPWHPTSLALVAVLSTALLGANCKSKDGPAPLGGDAKVKPPEPAAARPPDDGLTEEEATRLLPGIDTTTLTPKQRADLNDLANDIPCPCASMMVGGCLREKIACPVAPRIVELSKRMLVAGLPAANAALRVETYYVSFAKEKRKAVTEQGATVGPADARIKIVEFSDFQCPACRAAHPALEQLAKKYPADVRWNFRQFPLPQHDHAAKAAQCALWAQDQGKFWPLADAFFANQDKLDDAGLLKLAKEVGLDGEAMLKSVASSDKYAERVEKDKQAGIDLAIGGTPSIFINGRQFILPNTFEMLSWSVEDELSWLANNGSWESTAQK